MEREDVDLRRLTNTSLSNLPTCLMGMFLLSEGVAKWTVSGRISFGEQGVRINLPHIQIEKICVFLKMLVGWGY
jgi:hypothetical protein